MKVATHFFYFTLCFLTTMLFASCDKDDDKNTPKGDKQLPTVIKKEYWPTGNQINQYVDTYNFEYDDKNRVSKITFLSKTSTSELIANWTYQIAYTSDGKVNSAEYIPIGSLNDHSAMLRIFEYNGNTIIIRNEFPVFQNISSREVDQSIATDTILIDSKDRIIRKTVPTLISESENVSRTSYEYDTDGNLIKEISDFDTITYTYDKSKKGAFRAVESPQWLMVLLTNMTTDYVNAVTNRLYSLTYTPNVSSIFTNSYNADGFLTEQLFASPYLIGGLYYTKTFSYIKAK